MDAFTLPPLGALRTFEVAARHLSFKRAAQELRVTPTAISHQIRLLEQLLGRALFIRRARQVELTAAGQQLYPAVHEGFATLTRGLQLLQRRVTRDTVTISATMAFTSRWLVPRVGSFRRAEPSLDLSFLAADHALDLTSGVADLAVRYGTPPWPGLTAELLLRDRFLVVASPLLRLRKPTDIKRHALIHFEWRRHRADTPVWPLWFAQSGHDPSAFGGELSFSDETHAVQAAVAGHGIALLSQVVIADELKSGALVRAFGPDLPGRSYYLVYPEGALSDARISKVRRWLLREKRMFVRSLST